jgi:hypothetical protein
MTKMRKQLACFGYVPPSHPNAGQHVLFLEIVPFDEAEVTNRIRVRV